MLGRPKLNRATRLKLKRGSRPKLNRSTRPILGARSALGADSTLALIIGIIFALYVIVGSIASFTAGIRRLHDTNRSGWLVLVFWLLGMIPFVNFISWIVYIVFICQAGTPGDNRFGPQPE